MWYPSIYSLIRDDIKQLTPYLSPSNVHIDCVRVNSTARMDDATNGDKVVFPCPTFSFARKMSFSREVVSHHCEEMAMFSIFRIIKNIYSKDEKVAYIIPSVSILGKKNVRE